MKKRWKISLAFAGGLLILIAGAMAWKARLDSVYYEGYDASLPLNDVVRGIEERDGYRRVDFTFEDLPGQIVPTLLALPLDESAEPYPCIIFLHGIGQSKGFLDEIAALYTKSGFAIASFDQYTRGERKLTTKNPFKQAGGLRRRAALNVIDTRRLVDYLHTRDDIAADRIYLIGASFGAITGCNAMALEPRIRAAVLTYGGGNLGLLLSSDAAKKELGMFHTPVIMAVVYLTAPAEPLINVAQIAPRPVLFQYGTHDQLIPLEAAKALVDAAGEPKKFIEYDSDHVGMDEAQTLTVLNDTITWLKEQDATITAAYTPAAASASPIRPASLLPPSNAPASSRSFSSAPAAS